MKFGGHSELSQYSQSEDVQKDKVTIVGSHLRVNRGVIRKILD